MGTGRTVCAMREVHSGFFPDVGASRFLTLCPGRVGLYLALTGTRVRAAAALYCGFATHYVPQARVGELMAALATLDWRSERAREQIDGMLARFAADPGPARLPALQPAIDRCFGAGSVEAIVAALEREPGEWAKEALAAIARASPVSLKIAFRQLQLGRRINIEQALALEYRMTQHAMAGHDFFEGIRAALVDKDQRPRWQHASLAAVTAAGGESCFARLGERGLRLCSARRGRHR